MRPRRRRRRPHPQRRPSAARTGRLSLVVAVALLAVAGIVAALLLLSTGSDEPDALALDLPQGPLLVAGVEAPEPLADLGRVPLDTLVSPTFLLRNVADGRVYLGTPSIETLEGC